MIEYKQSTFARVPVRIINTSTGLPVAGVTSGSVLASAEKSDGTLVSLTVTGTFWSETTFGAFNQAGKYDLILDNTVTNTPGILMYAVQVQNADTYIGAVKIVANEEVDTYTSSVNNGVTLAQVSGTLLQLSSSFKGVSGSVDLIRKIETGRWKYVTTGSDIYKWIPYDPDTGNVLTHPNGNTIKFIMLDANGSGTLFEPFERSGTT